MLDKFPPEICAHIFDFACRDPDCTGRSLSLVSRYIHQTSELARYMSIVLVGRAQILAFAQFVEHTDIQLKTRHLFINGHENYADMYSTHEREGRRPNEKLQAAKDAILRASYNAAPVLLGCEVANAVEFILRSLGPTLEVLDMSVNLYVDRMLVHPISLPRLVDLTTRCSFPLRPSGVLPALEPTHSLRYLHIVDTSHHTHPWHCVQNFFENGISYFALSLTRLRIADVRSEVVITHLECALVLDKFDHKSNEHALGVTQLPSTIELVLLEPEEPDLCNPQGCPCCFGDEEADYRNLVERARLLQDMDHRVQLLTADSIVPADDSYLQEWRDKAFEAGCDWDTSDPDSDGADYDSDSNSAVMD
ncbi:hypothetical protein C8R45DRAFT_924719 [Mycena sanguinolenta]|nr:hypothetical protein C8R45DRAFT_924719 [Mycena sanguinolenta]